MIRHGKHPSGDLLPRQKHNISGKLLLNLGTLVSRIEASTSRPPLLAMLLNELAEFYRDATAAFRLGLMLDIDYATIKAKCEESSLLYGHVSVIDLLARMAAPRKGTVNLLFKLDNAPNASRVVTTHELTNEVAQTIFVENNKTRTEAGKLPINTVNPSAASGGTAVMLENGYLLLLGKEVTL
jgi:hypothetical protein